MVSQYHGYWYVPLQMLPFVVTEMNPSRKGDPPYLNQNPLKVLYLITTNATPTIANPENLSPTFRNYLAKTLKVDADKQPHAMQFLQHPFFAISGLLHTLSLLIKAAHKIARNK